MTQATRGVINRQPILKELANVKAPTLILVGDQDVATTPEKAERIHAAIVNSRLVIIPGAGHSSTLEEPAAINAAINAFLEGITEPTPVVSEATEIAPKH
jgi:pimeloyl-ACP methyl ester carboxylesterase